MEGPERAKGGELEQLENSDKQRLKILGKHCCKAEKNSKKNPKKLLVPAKSCFKHTENKALFNKKLFYASIQNGHSDIL